MIPSSVAKLPVEMLSEQPFFGESGLLARMYRMDNGLRVLLVPDPSAPIIAYQTWFRVGSRNEHAGKTGLAHLFEHLMFNETENLPHGEFDRLIERVGGHTNAATWADWTYYQDDLPKSELALACRLEAERMSKLVVRRHQVETERGVVMSERRLRVEDDVDGFMSEELFRLAFDRGHPYQWPTIGWMRDIKRLSLKDAMSFYRTYYAPNNATLVIVGDLDEAEALTLVHQHYQGLVAQDIPAPHKYPKKPQTSERRARFVKEVQTDKLLVGYRAPAFTDIEHVRLDFLSELLFGAASSPLYADLVFDKELVSSVGASLTPFAEPGLWEIGASLKRGHTIEEALAVIDAHFARVCKEGVLVADVERTRARLLTEFYSGMRTAHGKAAQLGEFETTAGDYRELFKYPAQLRAITPDALHQTARRFLKTESRTVVSAHPKTQAPRTKKRPSLAHA